MLFRNDAGNGDMPGFGLPGAVLVVIAVSVSLLACSKAEAPKAAPEVVRPVKLMTIGAGEETLNRSLPGRVRAAKRVELAFQIGGTLIAIAVKQGQRVKKGDLLARLDPRDFEVALRDAKAQMERAKALLRLSKIEYERLARVKAADPGAVAQSHLDRAAERRAMAHADLQTAAAAVDAAELKLSYTYLKAPFSGIVSSRLVDNYQEVQAKQTVFSLDDLSLIEVYVEFPESLMAPIRSPAAYQICAEFAPATGKRYPLTLKEYSLRGDPKTLTYQVVFQMPQPHEVYIFPGMTATVSTEPKKGAARPILIPTVALFAQQGRSPEVWVVDTQNMTVHLRKVKTGSLAGADSIEIAEGLQEGETIAVSAVNQLREGMKICMFKD